MNMAFFWAALAAILLAGMAWDWHRGDGDALLSSVIIATLIAAVILWPVRMYCRAKASILD